MLKRLYMSSDFDAKNYFGYFVKEVLNPILSGHGYRKKRGNCWGKVNDQVYQQIKIVKSISNTSRAVSFHFSIGLCPVELVDVPVIVQGKEKNWKWSNETFVERHETFLSKDRISYKNESKLNTNSWYLIFREDEFEKLVSDEITVDLEDFLLPVLKKINKSNDIKKLLLVEENNYGQIWYVKDFI